MQFMRLQKYLRACISLLLVWSLSAPAVALDLKLTSGDWRPINLFVESFADETSKDNTQLLSDIIYDDLSSSGYFRGYKRESGSYGKVDAARYSQVRNRGGEYLLAGQIKDSNGEKSLQFELHDALTEKSLGSYSIGFTPDNRRLAAHKVSNWVFETVVRLPSVFHTKIAYIVREEDDTNLLRVADYDGHNAHTVLSSADPLISPAWSPNGNEILYVSFERRRPVVYRQSLLTGDRRVVANFKGSNSSPSMSPNGQQVAAALTQNEHQQQIFLISENNKQRLRESDSVDTEPAWSPDGERLVFESDETGSPQLYEIELASGEVQRLSYGSKYCVSPSYNSTGEQVLHIRRDDNRRENVAVLDMASGDSFYITDISRADSPSFSPNDAMILFKDEKNDNFLQIISVNGIISTKLKVRETGKIINPVWGPARSDWF